MKGLLILILGTILLNSVFALVPTFLSDSDPGTYLPYQFWFNILLVFMWILPSYKGAYLFEPTLDGLSSTETNTAVETLPDSLPDSLPDGSASWVDNDKNPITDPITAPITDPITDPIKDKTMEELHMTEHDY